MREFTLSVDHGYELKIVLADDIRAACGYDCRACYQPGGPVVMDPSTMIPRIWGSSIFGTIYLDESRVGVGAVAHELLHFLIDWTTVFAWDLALEDEEKACRLFGRLTTDFWRQYKESRNEAGT